ncbi:IclR family transcriptional regulator [Rhodovulum sp. DZ06]|uniref:IclR family transcriptional regulator n=1 Tax=Rhodovulum sp. DZ06 TaxID=3425126 RepID=UPI003D35428F
MSGEEAGKARSGAQSLDLALVVLGALRDAGGPAALSDLARACDMAPSKVHRYLGAFVRAGLAAQVEKSGKYTLGPGAMALGLAALARHDFVNDVADALPELCAATGMTGLVSVWSPQGAVVVRWERAESPAVTSMGLGSALPLLNSASGRVFLAWGAEAPLRGTLAAELSRAKKNPRLVPDLEPTQAGVKALRERLRGRGYATVDGDFIPGLVALAAPVLDWQGEAQLAVTLIGSDPAALDPGGPAVAALTAFGKAHSVG